MNKTYTLIKKMKACNPYAIAKSDSFPRRLLLEILEVDDEGTLWCWVAEEDYFQVGTRQLWEVSLHCADNASGMHIVIKGDMAEVNFFPTYLAHLIQKNKSGYLMKMGIREMEYFNKQRLTMHNHMFHTVRKYSMVFLKKMKQMKWGREMSLQQSQG